MGCGVCRTAYRRFRFRLPVVMLSLYDHPFFRYSVFKEHLSAFSLQVCLHCCRRIISQVFILQFFVPLAAHAAIVVLFPVLGKFFQKQTHICIEICWLVFTIECNRTLPLVIMRRTLHINAEIQSFYSVQLKKKIHNIWQAADIFSIVLIAD